MRDLARPGATLTTATPPHAATSWSVLAVLLAGAGVIYGPIMRLGLLSDDFALVAWARAGDFLPPTWEYVRPVPIVIWAVLTAIVPAAEVPFALHALNIVCHAINAWLVFLLAQRFGRSTAAAALAAALFLLYPTAVEPVVWPTAIFDLVIAMGLLLLALIVTSRPRLTHAQLATGLLIAAIMLGTKETAVATAPLIVLLVAARWGREGRDGYRLAAGIAGLAAVYLVWRFGTGRLTSPPAQLGPGVVKALLLDPFAALLFPFHENVRRAHPGLVWLFPTAIVGVLIVGLWGSGAAHQLRRLLGIAMVWVILAAAPLLGMFVVGADLQGARYVYVPACLWTIAIAAAFVEGHERPWVRPAAFGAAALVLSGMAVASTAHLAPWHEAARARDGVVVALDRLPALCSALYLESVPDNVEGAPVFRNGLIQALAERGRTFDVVHAREDVSPACRVSFFDFERVQRAPQPQK